MKKSIILIFTFLTFSSFAQEQNTPGGYDPSNWFTGGSISLSIGGYDRGFLAGLNPHFGYTFARWIDAALAANFQYSTARDEFSNKYRSTTYGLGIFTRIYPVSFLFIQAQPEYNLILQKFIPFAGETLKDNIKVPSLLLGLGYTPVRSDKNSFTYFSILVDVLKNTNSPYIDGYGRLMPVVRAGFNIGLNRKYHER